MNKLKDWLLWYLLVGSYVWSWCGILACIFGPLVLCCCYSPWWLLSWIVTMPAVYTIVIVMGVEKEDDQE